MRKLLPLLASFSALYAVIPGCGGGGVDGFCEENEEIRDGQCMENVFIGTNTVGFLPERQKRAAYKGSSADFEIVDVESGEVVLSGVAEGPVVAEDTNETVYVADFTSLRTPGRYFVRASGEISGEFRIDKDVMSDALKTVMIGLYGQRCGVEVTIHFEGDTYSHGAGHTAPAELSRLGLEGTQDDRGGWHDAGDYGKYVRNGAFSVANLLQAYEHFPESMASVRFEIPERGGDTPDILDEARVELEWLLKTQLDDGSFPHKVTALNFEGEVLPTSDTNTRYFFTPSSHSVGNATAVLAAAARIYEEFDADFAETCLKAAEAGYEWLQDNPQEVNSEQNSGGTGTYSSGGDADERAWAAAELWETTGETKYLDDYEGRAAGLGVQFAFDWPDTTNYALATYLFSERDGRSETLVEDLKTEVVRSADNMVAAAEADPYGRGFTAYYWGSTGVTARMSLNLVIAHRFFPNRAYLDAIQSKLDYLFGRNSFARSFVTRMGTNPPMNPHHRPSRADAVGDPWPGLLIGGPNGNAAEWKDEYASYQTNEIAINWNTALAYALAAAHSTRTDEDADCVPNCLPDDSQGGAGGGGH